MEGLNKDQILEALNGNAELLTEVTNHVLESEIGSKAVENRSELIYKDRIGGEVSKIHKSYDDDMFDLLGEKPETLEGGGKKKTYEKIRELFSELKGFRDKSSSLDRDEVIKSLKEENERLLKGGGADHWQKTYENDKNSWLEEKKELSAKLKEANNHNINFRKELDIDKGMSGLKFNESIPKEAIDSLIAIARQSLIENSSIEDGKVFYYSEDGSRLNRPDYTPMSANDVLKNKLKSVLHNEDNSGGGGAPPNVGTIGLDDGNDGKTRKLVLDESKLTSKLAFTQESERVLLENGITRTSEEWSILQDEAYKRYDISKKPRN